MTIDTPTITADDWPLLLAERNELRVENEHLSKALMKLKEENKMLQSSVKTSRKKLALTDSTFGVANLCK